MRSRRWKADERIPTEDPSWRVALAKFRSSRSRLFMRLSYSESAGKREELGVVRKRGEN